MPRILMLNNEYPPLGGGMATVNRQLLEYLAKDDNFKVDLITSAHRSEPSPQKIGNNVSIYYVRVPGGNIHHASHLDLLAFAVKAFVTALTLGRKHRYDLIFAWSSVPSGAVAYGVEKILRVPYVVRLTGPDIPGFEARYRFLYPALQPLLRVVWRNSRRLIAKSRDEEALLRKSYSAAEVTLIPNGCAPYRGPERSLSMQMEGLKILCVGRLVERKGQATLIKAAAELLSSGIKLSVSLVGDGDSKEEYKRLAKCLGIEDRVKFYGYVPRESLAPIYQSHDVFVLPSENESMSVAALEALASGMPLIVTRGGGAEEFVLDEINGWLIDRGDHKHLKELLLILAQDADKREGMGKASSHIAKKFSWDEVAHRYVQFIKDVSGGG